MTHLQQHQDVVRGWVSALLAASLICNTSAVQGQELLVGLVRCRVMHVGTGDPLEGVTVRLFDGQSSTAVEEQVTDANGEALFADVPFGEYRVHAEPPDGMYGSNGLDVTVSTANLMVFKTLTVAEREKPGKAWQILKTVGIAVVVIVAAFFTAGVAKRGRDDPDEAARR